ncbi:hairy-related 8a isoform X1 [Acipenser oxyrinchus oxyrinchus]|uniref:Hairy-related 8a isoform X1 n=1 Tax=Acipenser oxyrinchus oxyrinchus TaxID=40147 RepID=A0AAD8CCY1_ACIOX|nr:hairy-related 8a isoform X1 [Acipenser oxyrinchus oxyrinchus]
MCSLRRFKKSPEERKHAALPCKRIREAALDRQTDRQTDRRLLLLLFFIVFFFFKLRSFFLILKKMTASGLANTSEQSCSAKEERKLRKPLIERKRRERINCSLDQLKGIMVDAYNLDQSKLEKADVLEITVQHMEGLQRAGPTSGKECVEAQQRYSTGYIQCMHEVHNLLLTCQGLDKSVGARLLNHLLKSLPQISSESAAVPGGTPPRPPSSASSSSSSSSLPASPLYHRVPPCVPSPQPSPLRHYSGRHHLEVSGSELMTSPPGSPPSAPSHPGFQPFLSNDRSMWRPW